MSVYSITQIKSEAIAAAQNPQYKTVNDACPYPFHEDAGRIFAAEFKRARAVINAANYSNTNVGPAPAVDGAEQAAQ